jgi:hypothetical protein
MGGYWAFSLIMTVLLIPMTLKVLRPLRIDPGKPYEFAKPHGSAPLESFTGYASDFGKWTETKTHIDFGKTVHLHETVGGLSGTVTDTSFKTTTLHAEFFLNRPDGTAHRVHLKHLDVPNLGSGQLVSVVWDSAKGTKWTAIIRNHSTRETYYATEQILGPAVGGWVWTKFGRVGLATVVLLGLFAFPLGTAQVIAFSILSRIRMSEFRKTGAAPLIHALDQRAAEVEAQARAAQAAATPQPLAATPQRSASDELSRLYALYQQGAITTDEYERAKLAALEG